MLRSKKAITLILFPAMLASCSVARSESDSPSQPGNEVRSAYVSPYGAEVARFIGEINSCGLSLPTPSVQPGNGSFHYFYDVETSAITAPGWNDLTSEVRQTFENRSNPLRNRFSSAQEEHAYFSRFIVIHEAAHYVIYANNLALSQFWGEVEANKIAMAYFENIEPNIYLDYISDIIAWYSISDEQAPGIDRSNIEAWFNENYGRRMSANQYAWFQQEMLRQLRQEARNPDIDLCRIMDAQRRFVRENPNARIR